MEEIVAAPVYKAENMAVGIRCADYATPSIRKHWHYLRRQATVARSVEFARGLRLQSLFVCFYISQHVCMYTLRYVYVYVNCMLYTLPHMSSWRSAYLVN
jgi:hypothetical protein